MRHQYCSEYEDDLKRFKDLNIMFKSLHKELRVNHEKWLKLHQTEDEDHLQRHSELIDRERQIFEEVQRLTKSTDEVVQRHLQKL